MCLNQGFIRVFWSNPDQVLKYARIRIRFSKFGGIRIRSEHQILNLHGSESDGDPVHGNDPQRIIYARKLLL